jgi:D-glycerate 3-kinase
VARTRARTPDRVAAAPDAILTASWVEALLAAEALPEGYRALIDQVHAPLAQRIGARAARGASHPWIVGLCGPQGSGKSTLALSLRHLLEAQGLRATVLSLDDLYLTRAQRAGLARRVHPLLALRGVPGTHDVGLGLAVLDALRGGATVALPRFDKGRDERMPEASWPRPEAVPDVLLFEGWCVGARPQADAELAQPVNALERDEDPDGTWRRYVNGALAGDYQRLYARIDELVLLQVADFAQVRAWRLEQEHKLRARLGAQGADLAATMDDAQLARFIQLFERLTRHIQAEMPARAGELIAARRA